jgi:2-dehydro-3-deoxyphosphogluconate aldolase/(4S)-4-hydroxy-2-oxoglutarate aldolase
MDGFIRSLYKTGIVPVIELDDVDKSEKLVDALKLGGLKFAEVTFRTDAAGEVIHRMLKRQPDMMVGAGTVVTKEQVNEALAQGAKFIVSPGLNPDVVRYCIDRKVPIIPGTQTPSEMEQAMSFGLTVVKFFPAEAAGGLKMLQAVAAPYRQLYFMPTGGLNAENVINYLKYDRIVACGGSWIASKELLKKESFVEIRKRAERASELAAKYHGEDYCYNEG